MVRMGVWLTIRICLEFLGGSYVLEEKKTRWNLDFDFAAVHLESTRMVSVHLFDDVKMRKRNKALIDVFEKTLVISMILAIMFDAARKTDPRTNQGPTPMLSRDPSTHGPWFLSRPSFISWSLRRR